MANQENAFIIAMQIAAHHQPELFSIHDGDFYFMAWRLPAWLVLAMADKLHALEEQFDEPVNNQRMRAVPLEAGA